MKIAALDGREPGGVMTPQERKRTRVRMEKCARVGEKALDDMSEARTLAIGHARCADAKTAFINAIEAARELGLRQEIEHLEKRLLHVKHVYRNHFA